MMKRLLISLCLLAGAQAQEYSVKNRTVDGGGGESKGGGYVLRGTIGQPEAAGVSAGGGYLVSGGFWNAGILLVNVPGAPRLSLIMLVNRQARLSWTSPGDEEWFLQVAGLPKEGEWKEVEEAESPLDFTPSGKRQFFRLKKRE